MIQRITKRKRASRKPAGIVVRENRMTSCTYGNLATIGNEALLNCEKIGFLASRRVPPEAVMRCLDWATRMRDEGVCVMSGFQSPLEKEVLNILLKGTSPLILVLARRMWDERHIPTLFRKPLAEGRLLVVSPVSQSIRRPTQPLHPRPRRQPLLRRARSRRLADRPPSSTLAFI